MPFGITCPDRNVTLIIYSSDDKANQTKVQVEPSKSSRALLFSNVTYRLLSCEHASCSNGSDYPLKLDARCTLVILKSLHRQAVTGSNSV
eukprot:1540273-Amphidinium_carterae.1